MLLKVMWALALPDSFNSNEGSNFNKVAIAFLALVEKSVAENTLGSLKFDQLLLQMMNLEVEDKINNTVDIPDVLNS